MPVVGFYKQQTAFQFVSFCFLGAFFFVGLAIDDFTSLIYHSLALIALVLFALKSKLELDAGFTRAMCIWLYVCLAYCAVGLLSWGLNGLLAEQGKWLGLQGKFLLLPLVFWFMACAFKEPNSLRLMLFLLFSGGAISAGLLGIDSRYQLLGLMPYEYRVGLAVNPIYYGDTALVMGFVSGVFAVFWAQQKRYILMLIGILALLLGVISSGLSISRGGWLALPLFLGFLLFYLLRNRFYITSALGVAIAIALVAWVLIDSSSPVHQRIFEGKQSLESFNLETSRTSAGYRLRMWYHAIELFQKKPVLGHGPMSYVFNDYNEQGQIVQYFHHAHNGYLQNLSNLGLIGLASYLLLFLFPLRYFYRAWKAKHAPETALSGMLLIGSYMLFIITDVIFYRSVGLLYFLVMVSLLILLIERTKQKLASTMETHTG